MRRRHRTAALFAAIGLFLICPFVGHAQDKQVVNAELEEAKRLEQQVGELFEAAKYVEAIEAAQRALALREKWLPPDHLDVAESLNDLGALYQQQRASAQAKPLLLRALALREKALKPSDPLIVETLGNLAAVYREDTDYRNAAPLLQSILSLTEQRLGPDHREVASSLNSLATLYMESGDYTRAEPLFDRALAIRQKAFGPEHPLSAQSLNNLAALYRNKGEYARAESLFEQALAIREKAPGPDQRDLASSLNNLAGLYQLKGDFDRAEPLFERALTIRQKIQPDSLAVAESLNNLGLLYKEKRNYARAEPLYLRSLDLRQARLKPGDPDVATALSNLALLYFEENQMSRAEELFQKALSIRERAFGNNHHIYAQSVSNLASLYFLKGEYQQSELLHRRAFEIFERTLGPQHPLTCLSRNNLAQILEINGRSSQAGALLALNNEIREKTLAPILTIGSEREKLAYLATLSEETDFTISFQLRSSTNKTRATRLALTTILRRKGRVVDVMSESITSLRRRANPEDLKLLDRLFATRAQLASLMLGGPQRTSLAENRVIVARLEAEIQKLEAQVSARSAQFRVSSQPVTFERIQKMIPSRVALVEFALYRPFNTMPKTTAEVFGAPRYVAYIVRKRGPSGWVELGDAKEIDERIDQWRKALRDPRRTDVKQTARKVDEKVMQPVRKLLGKTVRVLLSPDGALNLVPFAALVDERGKYLVSRYSFAYLTSGRDLLRMKTRAKNAQGSVVIADPDFDQQGSTGLERKISVSSEKTTAKEIIDFSQVSFPALPSTAEEAQALGQILPGVVVLVREQATEAAIKSIAAPEILHVATHGFFLNEVLSPARRDSRGMVVKQVGSPESRSSVMRIDNPLLRSGLALAGANQRQSSDGEDGILTALEAAGLNLWGTRLVVLSACDTAVGDIKAGDGVYGLRRALLIAGAESEVISLWPVNDQATRDLMIGYYQAMRAGQDQSEALRKAQLKMIGGSDHQHPYFWASFIHSGRWQSINLRPRKVK